MSILLNHTIVPAYDRVASAKFFAQIFGLEVGPAMGPFVPVQVNDTFTLDFDDRAGTQQHFDWHHYAFQVTDEEFDAVFGRLKVAGIPYGSGPHSLEDGQLNHRHGGRGVYFRDRDGHILELLTRG